MTIRFFVLVFMFIASGRSEFQDLEKCKQQLDAMVSKVESPLLAPLMKFDREWFLFRESVAGRSEALGMTAQFSKAEPDSPEAFLYSNAVQSCNDLLSDFKNELWFKTAQWLGFLLGVVMTGFGSFYFLRRKA